MAVKIDDFSKLKYIDYGKVFLILYFKKFSWKKELQNEYNISTEIITNAIKILKMWDLIVEVNFNHLGIENKQNLWQLNSSYYDLLKTKSTIFKLSNKAQEGTGYFLYENLIKEAKSNENLSNFIANLISKIKIDKNELDLDIQDILNKNSTEFKIDVDKEEIEYFKVFLVLFMKGFSWKKELQNDFNISSKVVLKAIEILERQGFIIAKDFWSLDLDSQECIRRLNGAYSYLIKSHPQIYTLSIEGYEYGKNVVGKYKEEAEKNSSLRATIEFITEKVRAYHVLKKKFDELENTLWIRDRIDHETGVVYSTSTLKKLEFEKKLKLASKKIAKIRLESKKTNLLSENQKNELQILTSSNLNELVEYEIKKDKLEKHASYYNGVRLNSIEQNELEKKLNEKQDNSKAKIGLDELQVDMQHIQRIKELKESLGIGIENKNLKELNEDRKVVNKIIQQIKNKKWMDSFLVQKECKNDRRFNLLLSLLEENQIVDDGEDLRYVGK